jgi:hypothetical protein
MTRRALLILLGAFAVSSGAAAAEREWQKGIWEDYTVERPRVLFSAQPRDPNNNVPAAPREIRTFIIETDTHRLELRQDATVDTPRIDVFLGQPVLFAIDKKTVYIKDADGKEHKLSLRKQTPKPKN